MRPARALLPVGLVLAVACADASERTEGPPDTTAATDPQLVFWASLESLCGQAFRGHVVESEPPDASFEGQALVMHVRECQIGEVRNQWVVTPALEAESVGRQLGEPLAKGRIEKCMLARIVAPVRHRFARVPGALVTDAAKAAATGPHVCVEHLAYRSTEVEVRGADDAGRDATRTV